MSAPLATRIGVFVVATAALAGLGWPLYEQVRGSHIASVRVAGTFSHLQRADLEKAVAAHIDAGFFDVDVEAVRAAAMRVPWVKDASVRRIWPDSLHIAVVEREPVARWGESALVEADASIFVPVPARVPKGLPLFDAPEGSAPLVLRRYQLLREALAPTGLKITRLSLNERRAWRVQTDRGPELLLGQEPALPALRRFTLAYRAVLAPRVDEVERVDLRYANGFAVRWRTQEEHSEGS